MLVQNAHGCWINVSLSSACFTVSNICAMGVIAVRRGVVWRPRVPEIPDAAAGAEGRLRHVPYLTVGGMH